MLPFKTMYEYKFYMLTVLLSLISKYHNFNTYKHGKPPLICKKGTTHKISILQENQEEVSVLIWQMLWEGR